MLNSVSVCSCSQFELHFFPYFNKLHYFLLIEGQHFTVNVPVRLFSADVRRASLLPDQMNQNKGVNAAEVTLWLMRTSPYMMLDPGQTIDIRLCCKAFFSIENLRADSASSDISKNPQLNLIAELLSSWF